MKTNKNKLTFDGSSRWEACDPPRQVFLSLVFLFATLVAPVLFYSCDDPTDDIDLITPNNMSVKQFQKAIIGTWKLVEEFGSNLDGIADENGNDIFVWKKVNPTECDVECYYSFYKSGVIKEDWGFCEDHPNYSYFFEFKVLRKVENYNIFNISTDKCIYFNDYADKTRDNFWKWTYSEDNFWAFGETKDILISMYQTKEYGWIGHFKFVRVK
jgi:hypothetical protein